MAIKIICRNKKAFHDYFIDDTYEAGIVLEGSEVKSLRDGKANMSDAYGRISDGEMFIVNLHISPYEKSDTFRTLDPSRSRKLLLHKKEIEKLTQKTREMGLTLIPTKLYFKGSRAKVEIGVAKGKKLFDKRETLKKKAQERDSARAMSKPHKQRSK